MVMYHSQFYSHSACLQSAASLLLNIILPRDAAMVARSWDRNSVHPSVCLCVGWSVRLSHACFVMKRKKHTAEILIPHESAINLVF